MILLTGGTSFNANEFVNDCHEEMVIIRHSNKVEFKNPKVIYLDNLNDLKKFKMKNQINTVINFASSINSKNNLISNFFSSFYPLLKIYFILRKSNIDFVINIGSMWQDIPKMRFRSYVFIKNLTDFIFTKFIKEVNYLSLKLGDTYGVGDKRNKLVKILKDQLNQNNLELKGRKENLVFPIHTKTLSKIINYLLLNKKIFLNSDIKFIRTYVEPLSLLEFTKIFSEANNFNKKIIYGMLDGIFKNDLKPKNDFCFLINEDLKETLQDI